jgi:NAD(P)-dependent dehydrogenase (short-subunit alcohol dehydrogenase family)
VNRTVEWAQTRKRELFDFSGRVAFISGGGQGVGAGIARLLAARGAVVAVNDIDEQRAQSVVDTIRSAGGSAINAVADVTDPGAVRSAVENVIAGAEKIDILINNAGVPATGMSMKRFVDTVPEEWEKFLQLNLYGVMHCTHEVLPMMIRQRWGRIINIGSDAGRFGEPLMAAYCAAKSGAAGFARGLAKEVGRYGVTVNTVSLGSIVTPHFDDPDADKRAQRYPMKRLGQAEDIAGTAVWLASEEAGWITGQTFSVNGGFYTAP